MRCSRRVCKRTLGLLTSVHERAVGTTRALAGATATVAALTLLGAALRFARLGAQGFWFDEGNTALLVHLSPGRMLGLIPQSESTPPLYYCVAWVWARVFGFAEAGLRSLSAVAGVITIPVTYATGRKLISRRVGVIVAGLTACSPLLIWYSQEARSYSLLVALSAVSLLALACALEQPTPLTLGCWVLASGLTLATHYYGVLVIVPEALWLLAARRRQRSVQVAVGLVALCGLALIPLALGQNATGNTNWIAPIPLGSRLGQVIPQFLVGFQTTAQSVLEPLAAALAVGALVLLALRSDAPALRRALALGAVAVGGLLLNLVLIAVGRRRPHHPEPHRPVGARRARRRGGVRGALGGAARCRGRGCDVRDRSDGRDWRRHQPRLPAPGLARCGAHAGIRAGVRQGDPDPARPRSAATIAVRARTAVHGGLARARHRARRGRDGRAARGPVLVGRGVQSVAIDAAALVSAARLSSGVAQARAAVHGARPAGLEARAGRPADRFAGLTATTIRRDGLLMQR
ncbi:MAG: glycosyltransferase family 39 protein [Solirubrobacteraceae bacterium]